MTDDWVLLRRCAFVHEAEFLKSVLDAAGIEAAIPDEHTLAINPGYVPMFGGVRLLVRHRDRQEADQVLNVGDISAFTREPSSMDE